MKNLLLFLCFTGFFSASSQEVIRLKELQQRMASPQQTLVINFWATWCGPCLKEIPYFETLSAKNKNVKVLLVSMDYDLDPNPEKVKKFVARKKIHSPVLILAEDNPSSWIDKIDKDWTGALPATLLINPNGKRKLVQGELHEGDLEKLVNEINQ
ncbi:MAG: TlpA family protein disulfide reductase [Bacteroidetes bacterium]|nr:TlpA family protein disulfide reductase [Bacteroidota bacterium]